MTYKIHPKVIDAVADIYQGDSTLVSLNDDTSEEVDVTSGIWQGSTGSTTLFKIVTYIITREKQKTTIGFRKEKFYIPILFFEDDGLILADSLQETQLLIKVLIKVSKKCGLDICKQRQECCIDIQL